MGLFGRKKEDVPKELPAKVVDEYSISVGPSGQFPTLWLTVKCDDGSVHGPYEFPAAYAHRLADELCIASARIAGKKTGGESESTSEGAERGQG